MVSATQTLCVLSGDNFSSVVCYSLGSSYQELAHRDEVDGAIISTEAGFSPLGHSADFFQQDLNISYESEIRPAADWNRFNNEDVSLVVFKSDNPKGILRGVVLAPGENCKSYPRSTSSGTNYSPTIDIEYYYLVSYQAITHLSARLGARRIAISHLSGSKNFNSAMAVCHLKALHDFCMANPRYAPETFTFCECCITTLQLENAQRTLGSIKNVERHLVQVTESDRRGAKVVSMTW